MEARQRVSLRRRSCQAAALASCCPICELKFPTKCNFDPDDYEKVILKHMMKCSASCVKSAALPAPAAPIVSNNKNPLPLPSIESGNVHSPFRSISLSSSSTSPSLNAPWASIDPLGHEKAGRTAVANMPWVNSVQQPFSISPELFSRTECDKRDTFERIIVAHNVQSFNPYQDCRDHRIDIMEQETPSGSRASSPTITSQALIRDNMCKKQKIKKRGKRNKATVPPKNIYKYTASLILVADNESHEHAPKVSRLKLKRDAKTPMEVCMGGTDVGGECDDDYSAAGYSSISDSNSVVLNKPPKKCKLGKKNGKQWDPPATVPNIDPNHFLNQLWWRKNAKRQTKKAVRAIPFDFQQCIVSTSTVVTKGRGKTVNLNLMDSMKVARGSNRLRTQAKDQLKLCCPICQKEFKASFGIRQLTEEMMIRHVSKCSVKMFEDGVRHISNKPLDGTCPLGRSTKPENVCSMILGDHMTNIQKPIHLSSTVRAELAAFHVMRAQSNQFLMHGSGQKGFANMFTENVE